MLLPITTIYKGHHYNDKNKEIVEWIRYLEVDGAYFVSIISQLDAESLTSHEKAFSSRFEADEYLSSLGVEIIDSKASEEVEYWREYE